MYFPVKINFHTEKPNNLREYYRLFNCTLKFNQPKTEIIFEKLIFDNHSKIIQFGFLENLKEKIAVEIESLSIENELIYQLKKYILIHKPQRVLIEAASHHLNLSKRTLQRKLNDLNTNFKEIEYELQLKLSKTYLEEKQKSIDEISYLLGFSESSAFIRFFKSLTKLTPTEYMDSIQ
jgi:AraC-like DNA-binding protein